jgi:hypothetical protein
MPGGIVDLIRRAAFHARDQVFLFSHSHAFSPSLSLRMIPETQPHDKPKS